jgi:hypothetical protein
MNSKDNNNTTYTVAANVDGETDEEDEQEEGEEEEGDGVDSIV